MRMKIFRDPLRFARGIASGMQQALGPRQIPGFVRVGLKADRVVGE